MGRKRPKPPTEEEKLACDLRDTRSMRINEPTIIYSVGDRVRHGNIYKSIVKEVLDGGKILLLDEHLKGKEYGREVESDRLMHVAWHEVKPWAENESAQRVSYDDDVCMKFMQQDISSLLHKYYHWRLNMEPEYQRDFVWEPSDETSLLDSIFNNIDIGKFSFCFLGYGEDYMYEILDGKQRLNTLVRFYEGRIKYKGMTYHEMCFRDRTHFKTYGVAVSETREILTTAQKLKYFLKLNTQGKPQDQAHLDRIRKMLAKEQEVKHYEHDLLCSGDRRYPPGTLGTCCSCLSRKKKTNDTND